MIKINWYWTKFEQRVTGIRWVPTIFLAFVGQRELRPDDSQWSSGWSCLPGVLFYLRLCSWQTHHTFFFIEHQQLPQELVSEESVKYSVCWALVTSAMVFALQGRSSSIVRPRNLKSATLSTLPNDEQMLGISFPANVVHYCQTDASIWKHSWIFLVIYF